MTLDIHLELLRKAADTLEQRYLSPVYLVGSFQNRYKDASDIDLIMVVTKDRYQRLTGSDKYCDKTFQFNRKQKLWCEQFVHDFDIDFKLVTKDEFDKHTEKDKAVHLGKYAWSPE